MRLLSAKSEELEGLRDGEPVNGDAAAVHGDGATGANGPSEHDGAEAPGADAGRGGADALAETVSLNAETVSLSRADERDHMRVRPPAGPSSPQSGQGSDAALADTVVTDAVPTVPIASVEPDPAPAPAPAAAPPVPVPQDVAEETARVVAEASGGAEARPVQDSAAGFGADDEPSEAPFPSRRQRHTPLYGRGVRVLPWKHKSRLDPRQRRRRKIVVRSLWGAVMVFFGTVGWSIAGALTSPGTDTVQARLAEWGRDHGMGGLVAQLEQWQYDLNPPSKGGSVDAKQFTDLGPTAAPPSSAKPSKNGVPSKPGVPSSPAADVIAMQPRMPAPPGLTLESGEGVFQVAVQTAAGQPVVQVTRIRPDSVYTDVTADVAVIDQKHSSYVLHPGHEGGLNSIITTVPNQIESNARPNLIALFNGGFKISESHGGYYDHGVTAASLADGAASEVIFKDGHMSVGMWGRDFSFQKNTNIQSVRQNLKLMVDNGQVVPYIDDSSTWGRADHGSAAVWRSGVGVKADGDIVWVGGNKLTAPSLARLLKDAGAVRAMQLDINLRWADFQYFPNRDGNPDTSKLYEDFLQGPNKFFVNSTKDFMAVYVR